MSGRDIIDQDNLEGHGRVLARAAANTGRNLETASARPTAVDPSRRLTTILVEGRATPSGVHASSSSSRWWFQLRFLARQ